MTTLTRWEPFRELAAMRDTMERLWEDPFDTTLTWPRRMGEFKLALDVAEDENAYIIKAIVPGVNPDDIEVTVADNMLTIKGEAKADEAFDENSYHIRERRYGSFMRSVTLPVAVKTDAVEATNEHGVLTLRLPKSETVKPKKITIKSTSNGKNGKAS